MLIAGYEDGYLYMFSVGQGMISRARFHDDPCLCLDIDSTRTQGVTGSASSSIGVFSIDYTKNELAVAHNFPITNAGIAVAKIRPDQRIMGTGGWDQR